MLRPGIRDIWRVRPVLPGLVIGWTGPALSRGGQFMIAEGFLPPAVQNPPRS